MFASIQHRASGSFLNLLSSKMFLYTSNNNSGFLINLYGEPTMNQDKFTPSLLTTIVWEMYY